MRIGKGVDERSFHLGMIQAFAEVVASGCKPLALGPPMDAGELESLRSQVAEVVAEYELVTETDDDFLTTRLFNPAFTEGKSVILLAASEEVLAQYRFLKECKRAALEVGCWGESEEPTARGLGALLGYSSAAVEGLLVRPRF
jgi:hypothetical protein